MSAGFAARASAEVLSRVPPGTPGIERGEEFGKTSPIALVVVLLLLLATVILIRSMGKRLRNVPESFEPADTGARPDDRAERREGGDGPAPPSADRSP